MNRIRMQKRKMSMMCLSTPCAIASVVWLMPLGWVVWWCRFWSRSLVVVIWRLWFSRLVCVMHVMYSWLFSVPGHTSRMVHSGHVSHSGRLVTGTESFFVCLFVCLSVKVVIAHVAASWLSFGRSNFYWMWSQTMLKSKSRRLNCFVECHTLAGYQLHTQKFIIVVQVDTKNNS